MICAQFFKNKNGLYKRMFLGMRSTTDSLSLYLVPLSSNSLLLLLSLLSVIFAFKYSPLTLPYFIMPNPNTPLSCESAPRIPSLPPGHLFAHPLHIISAARGYELHKR